MTVHTMYSVLRRRVYSVCTVIPYVNNTIHSPPADRPRSAPLFAPPKSQIRRVLLELCTTADIQERKVKSSASFAVSKIASADFPEHWPELLPSLLQIINGPASSAGAVHGALKVLHDLVDTGFNEEQFFNVARDLVTTLFNVTTNESRKPVLRALAVSVFRSCFDTLEMVLEQHKVAVKEFMDEVLGGWSPFFISTLKASLPQPPVEQEESKESASEWRGVVALKVQVVKVCLPSFFLLS